MTEIYSGLPRTGKTYRAVKYVFDNFVNPDSKHFTAFQYLYTNIGGFKHDQLNESLQLSPVIYENDSFIKQSKELDWTRFSHHISKLYDMANDKKSDDDLIEYLKKYNLYKTLLVVDEAYLFFTKKSEPHLVWFLAYHGHMGFHIILITQSPTLMHSDYRQFTEFIIEAQPKSKSLFNNQLRYSHMDNAGKVFNRDSIKADQKVFDLYKSGDVHKPKKIIYKFLMYGVILLGVLFGALYALFSRLTPDTPKPIQTIEKNVSVPITSVNELLILRCDKNTCWNTSNKYEDISISKTYFKFVAVEKKLKILYQETSNEIYKLVPRDRGYSKISLASLTDYYLYIPRDLKNDLLKNLFIARSSHTLGTQSLVNSYNTYKGEEATQTAQGGGSAAAVGGV